MSKLRSVAQRIRHLPGLRRMEGLWSALRKPYHRLLDAGRHGVAVNVGGAITVRMPAAYAGTNWEEYEPASIAACARWVSSHPESIVLDVGASTGIFSLTALCTSPRALVVAFDSDPASLAAARRMSSYAGAARLTLVQGFVGDAPTEAVTLAAAAAATERLLAASGAIGDVGTTRYVCMTDAGSAAVPCRRLDDLLVVDPYADRPMLVKCDVEGAEMRVLAGARALLSARGPDLLLSVHPQELPAYGDSPAKVRALLNELGYAIECIAVDHEEHWWCTRAR